MKYFNVFHLYELSDRTSDAWEQFWLNALPDATNNLWVIAGIEPMFALWKYSTLPTVSLPLHRR